MNQAASQRPCHQTPLSEEYWRDFLDHAAFWQRLDPTHRHEVLAAPLLAHDAPYVNPRRTDDVEKPIGLAHILMANGIDAGSSAHFRLFRLMQICHRLGDVHGPKPPDHATLATRLSEHVIDRIVARAYSNDRDTYWATFTEKPAVIDWPRLSGAGRLRRLLAIPAGGNGIEWEKSNILQEPYNFPIMLSGNHVLAFVQSMLRQLIDHGRPMPLATLIEMQEFNRAKQTTLMAKAIRSLVQHMLVVVDYDPADDGLRAGFWPGVLEKFTVQADGKRKLPPAAPGPEETFSHPLLATDLAVVLAEAFRAPLATKVSDNRNIYAATARRIEDQLTLFPSWAEPENSHLVNYRSQNAVDFAIWAGYLEFTTRGAPSLAITTSGIDLLKASPGDRLQTIVNTFKSRRGDNTAQSPWNFSCNQGEFWTTDPQPRPIEISRAMADAWGTLPDNDWLSVDAWLDYLTRHKNPLEMTIGSDGACGIRVPDSWGMHKIRIIHGEYSGEYMRPWLLRFFHSRLLALGGVELGLDPDYDLLIRLTAIGRYYLGQLAKFPALPDTATGRVVLQPNFEIVFLGPNLLARATLARFAEEIAPGKDTGTLFRLSKKSIQTHLHEVKPADGVDSILASLRETCGDALPANVVAEIRSWAEARREFTTRMVHAMTLPDKLTTLLAHGILKNGSTVVNDQTLLLEQALTSEQRKKLAKAGIFDAHPAKHTKPAKRAKHTRTARNFLDDNDPPAWDSF